MQHTEIIMPRTRGIPAFPWGKVPPQRRMRGGTRLDPVPPHTRPGLRPVHPLLRRGFFAQKTGPVERAGIKLLRLLARTLVELLGFIQRHCKLLRPFVDKSASEAMLHTNTTNGPVDPAIPRRAVDNPAESL